MEDLQIIQEENKSKKFNNKQNTIFAVLVSILIVLIIILITFTFICAPVVINGDSMSPSLEDGEIIMISKIHKSPDLGDIIVYKKPDDNNTRVIKRVIGVAGDVFLIGENLNHIYVMTKVNAPEETEYALSWSQYLFLKQTYGRTIQVQKGEVFTIGDNFNNKKELIEKIKKESNYLECGFSKIDSLFDRYFLMTEVK